MKIVPIGIVTLNPVKNRSKELANKGYSFGKYGSNIVGSLGLTKTAWVMHVQESYPSLEELEAYDETYGIAQRVGFSSAKELWDADPILKGGVNPGELSLATEEEYILNKDVDMDSHEKGELGQKLFGSKGIPFDPDLPQSFVDAVYDEFRFDATPHFVWIYPKGTLRGEPGPLTPAANILMGNPKFKSIL